MRTARPRASALLLALLATLAGVALGGCGAATRATGSAGEPLVLGVVNPFSGDAALYGEEVTRGYELAVAQANRRGGVGGRRIVLERGDAMTASDAITQSTRLLTKERAEVLVGTYVSAVASTASDQAARRGVLFWETNATADDLTSRGLPNFIRSGPRATDFADASVASLPELARRLGKPIGELRVFIEHEDSIYGTSVASRQEELLEEEGIQVVGVGDHAAAATDVTDSILRAKQARPDVWINTGYVPDDNLLLRTAAALDFTPPVRMLVGTGDTAETLESVGPQALAGTLIVAYPGADISERYGPGSRQFLDSYRAAYGTGPRAPQSLTAYVGMQVLLEALRRAGTTELEPLKRAALAVRAPRNSLATGFGVAFDREGQNQLASPVVTQWRPDGTRATVLPRSAAAGNEIEGLER